MTKPPPDQFHLRQRIYTAVAGGVLSTHVAATVAGCSYETAHAIVQYLIAAGSLCRRADGSLCVCGPLRQRSIMSRELWWQWPIVANRWREGIDTQFAAE